MTYELHELASVWPPMSEARLKDLARDIDANGLLEPITLYEGKVLDGRNRLRACEMVAVDPWFEEFHDADPVAFVRSKNAQRRDLTEGQRAGCILRLEELVAKARATVRPAHRPKKTESVAHVPQFSKTREVLAEAAGVSPRTMASVQRVQREAPELFEQVVTGTVTASKAERMLKRAQKKAELEAWRKAAKEPALDGLPSLVLADPPWRYDFAGTDSRKIENQYPTATVEEIIAHRPQTEENAVLFLWATAPKLLEALQVMAAWGFAYRTHAVWDKKKIGMGFWFRNRHELLLVGTKGAFACPIADCRVSSVFEEARQEHSQKPECVYLWVEETFPQFVKLEMYGRKKREGWLAWGNEA